MVKFFIFVFSFFPNVIIGQVYNNSSSISVDHSYPINTGTNMTIAIISMPVSFNSGDTIFSLFGVILAWYLPMYMIIFFTIFFEILTYVIIDDNIVINITSLLIA